MLKKPDYI